jgi:hypothetical protein
MTDDANHSRPNIPPFPVTADEDELKQWHSNARKALQAVKPICATWTIHDLQSIGFSHVEAETWFNRKDKTDLHNLGPPVVRPAALDANRRYGRQKGDFEIANVKGRFATLWDQPLPETEDRLRRFLLVYASTFSIEFEPTSPDVQLYWCLAREMRDAGLKLFSPWTFDRILEWARDKAEADEEARLGAERGRPPTDKSRKRNRVMKAIGCGTWRAYEILKHGTTSLAQRKALAAEFADDPARCFPAQWERNDGQRVNGRPPSRPFRDFCLAGACEFDDVTATRESLLAAYARGVLPDHFERVEDLVAELRGAQVNVPTDDLITMWHDFKAWRLSRQR